MNRGWVVAFRRLTARLIQYCREITPIVGKFARPLLKVIWTWAALCIVFGAYFFISFQFSVGESTRYLGSVIDDVSQALAGSSTWSGPGPCSPDHLRTLRQAVADSKFVFEIGVLSTDGALECSSWGLPDVVHKFSKRWVPESTPVAIGLIDSRIIKGQVYVFESRATNDHLVNALIKRGDVETAGNWRPLGIQTRVSLGQRAMTDSSKSNAVLSRTLRWESNRISLTVLLPWTSVYVAAALALLISVVLIGVSAVVRPWRLSRSWVDRPLAFALTAAVRRGEIYPAYEPIVDRSGSVVGFEALARWWLPGKGEIPPSRFIQLAESLGLITDLEEALHGRVVADFRDLLREGVLSFVSINLSTRGDVSGGRSVRFLSMLQSAGVPPASVLVEITETGPVDVDSEIIAHLIERGVPLALDDFGAGYANISSLTEPAFRVLKLDRTLTALWKGPRSHRRVLRAVVDMSRTVGMVIIAEGVESQEQLDFLRDCGVDYTQGHVHAFALSVDDARHLVEQQRKPTRMSFLSTASNRSF